MKKLITNLVFIILIHKAAVGVTYTAAIGTNTWGVAAFGANPTAMDDVIVPNGATVSVLNVVNRCRNLTIQNGGTVRFGQNNAWLRIKNGGSFIINAGGTLSRNSYTGLEVVFEDNTNYTFHNDGICNMSSFNGDGNFLSLACSGSTLTLEGSGNFDFENVQYNRSFARVLLSSGSTLRLSQDIDFNTMTASVFDNYGTLFCDEAGMDPGAGSVFYNRSGAVANVGWGTWGTNTDPFKASPNFTLYANYVNNLVNYCGTLASQNILVPANGYYNLRLSYILPLAGPLPGTENSKIVRGNFNVINSLTLNRGRLNLNGFTVDIDNGATSGITYTSGFIVSERTDNSSRVRWNIGTTTGSHIVPFGTNAGVVIPLTFNLTSGDAGAVIFSTYGTASDNLPWPISPVVVTNLSSHGGLAPDNRASTVDRFWEINPGGPSAVATLTLRYTAAEQPAAPYNSTMRIQRYDEDTDLWDNPLPGQTMSGFSVTVPAVQKFKIMTIASGLSLLPVNLISFEAEECIGGVKLYWHATNESLSGSYIIERSNDGIHYSALDTVKCLAGDGVSFYDITDRSPRKDAAYYRLLKTEDGMTYEPIGFLTVDFTGISVPAVYPIPNDGKCIHIHLPIYRKGGFTIRIIDSNGKFIYQETLPENILRTDYELIFPEKLGSGMYIINLSSPKEEFHYRVTVN